MKLKRDMPKSRGDFVTKYGEVMCNYLEQTHGREEAQVSSRPAVDVSSGSG